MQSHGGLATPPQSSPPAAKSRHMPSYSSSSEEEEEEEEESFAQLRGVLRRAPASHNTSFLQDSQESSPEKEMTPHRLSETPAPGFLVKEYTRLEQHLQPQSPTRARASKSAPRASLDTMTMHLLVETAMGDSEDYNILTPEELEAVKKEEQQLVRRIDAGKRRLFLESRVENTARLLRKLAAKGRKENGFDTSPAHQRKLLGIDDSYDSGVEEGDVDEDGTPERFGSLAQDIWRLERRRTELQNKRLEHTAGVLQRGNLIRALGGHIDGVDDDDLEFEDDIHDSTLSSPRQSVDHLSQLLDGTLEALGGLGDQRQRLQAINRALFDFIQRTTIPTDMTVASPPTDHASSSAEIAWLEEATQALQQRFGRLHNTLAATDKSVTQYEVESQQANVMLAELWESLSQTEDSLKRNSYIIQQAYPDSTPKNALAEELIIDDNHGIPDAQAIIDRVHRLCQQAESLSQRLLATKDELEDERHMHEQSREEHDKHKTEMTEQLQLIHNKNLEGQRALADAETKLTHNKARLNDMLNMQAASEKQMLAEHEDTLTNERAAHSEMKNALMTQVLEKQAALQEAHRKLAIHEENVSNMRSAEDTAHSEMRGLTTRLEELTLALESAHKDSESHRSTADGYARQLAELEDNKRELDTNYKNLQAEHEGISAHIGTITQKAAEHETSASDLNSKLKRALSEKQGLQEQTDALTAQLESAEERLRRYDSTAADQSYLLQQLVADKQNLQREHDRLKSEHTHLGNQLEAAEGRALEQEAAAQDGITEVSAHQSQIEQLRKQLNEFSAQLDHHRHLASSKDTLLAEHTERAAMLDSHRTDLEQEVERLTSELEVHARTQQEHEGLRSRYEHLSQELDNLRATAASQIQRNAELEAQLTNSTSRKTESETRVETLQKELADLVQDYETLVREELEVEKEREAMEATMDELKQKVEKLETTLSEERIRAMGQRGSILSERDTNEGSAKVGRAGAGTTMSVMRNEFKKMMREARVEHFKSLKVSCREYTNI